MLPRRLCVTSPFSLGRMRSNWRTLAAIGRRLPCSPGPIRAPRAPLDMPFSGGFCSASPNRAKLTTFRWNFAKPPEKRVLGTDDAGGPGTDSAGRWPVTRSRKRWGSKSSKIADCRMKPWLAARNSGACSWAIASAAAGSSPCSRCCRREPPERDVDPVGRDQPVEDAGSEGAQLRIRHRLTPQLHENRRGAHLAQHAPHQHTDQLARRRHGGRFGEPRDVLAHAGRAATRPPGRKLGRTKAA
jgi:hypothetical protein